MPGSFQVEKKKKAFIGAARGARPGHLGREGHSSPQAQPCAAPASWRRHEIPLPVGTSRLQPYKSPHWEREDGSWGFPPFQKAARLPKRQGVSPGGSCSSSNPAGLSYIHGSCSGPWKYDSSIQNKHRGAVSMNNPRSLRRVRPLTLLLLLAALTVLVCGSRPSL